MALCYSKLTCLMNELMYKPGLFNTQAACIINLYARPYCASCLELYVVHLFSLENLDF